MDQDVEMPDKGAELAEDWVCMTSPDGFTFLVKGKVAVVSGTLKNSLTSGLEESQTKLIVMTERGVVAGKLVEYLAHKSIYEKEGATDIPDFAERVAPEIALELLMAADYYEV
ncbi:POZ domain-containing protein [Thelephora ganbajun]|uniref:POZ domain-containing protein n=1 Tax=Thelephora ganbajun TaxID=370292 RepID=A0ACB6ZVX9_THEGA|nr:POZ domain-containing protein [Thelephora ganbajun]